MKNILLFLYFLFSTVLLIGQQMKTVKLPTTIVQGSKTINAVPNWNEKIAPSREKTETLFLSNDFNPPELSRPSVLDGMSIIENLIWYRLTTAELDQLATMGPTAFLRNWLSTLVDKLKVDYRKMTLEQSEITYDELGFQHIKFVTGYEGVPFYDGTITIHINENGAFIHGNIYPTPGNISTNPVILESQLKAIIQRDLPEGVIFDDNLNIPGIKGPHDQLISTLYIYMVGGETKLAYHVDARPQLHERWTYFIDAHSGDILRRFSTICKMDACLHGFGYHKDVESPGHDFNTEENTSTLVAGPQTANAIDLMGINRLIHVYEQGGTFFLIDGSRPMFNASQSSIPANPVGVIVTHDGINNSPIPGQSFNYNYLTTSSNNWTNPTAVSAHFNAAEAYTYFLETHNRNSMNGLGGNVISFINVAEANGQSMENAFWDGHAMYYGNGGPSFKPLARSKDVAGHELTHGVVGSTANLEYAYESGALNESFADVFGAMIDRQDWKIGEDVVEISTFPSGALRDLQDPHNGGTQLGHPGYQPAHVNEMYHGSQDNGGVHINSGIPNKAFYLFATAVGKDKAEDVYYRALVQYLTRTSNFLACRYAVVQSAIDMFGDNSPEVNAAKNAFTQVGIGSDDPNGNGTSPDPEGTDLEVNPGQEYIATRDVNSESMWVIDVAAAVVDGVSSTDPLSKASITDNGEILVYVSTEGHMILLDLTTNPIQEYVLSNEPEWRNIAISKDGNRIAAITSNLDNRVYIFDIATGAGSFYELFNPTSSTGVSTGSVLYADVLEWDYSGEWVMYDAFNRITGIDGSAIENWDIGFIRVWDNGSNNFVSESSISKLFNALPENSSIGNPTFSKNSPYIVAIDFIGSQNENIIYGVNVETGDVGLIYENSVLGVPNYSIRDNEIIFNAEVGFFSDPTLARIELHPDKISGIASTAYAYADDFKDGIWFATGERDLVETGDLTFTKSLHITPNPTGGQIDLSIETSISGDLQLIIYNSYGQAIMETEHWMSVGLNTFSLELSRVPSGTYFAHLKGESWLIVGKIVKE